MKDIKLGSTVTCPVTNDEGENHYRMGKLTAINSRYATVETTDGEVFKVGKTKIELVNPPKVSRPKMAKAKAKKEYVMPEQCPHCGVDLDANGIGEHNQEVNGKKVKHDEFQYVCLGCGGEFGPDINDDVLDRIADYEYTGCLAASGKKIKRQQ